MGNLEKHRCDFFKFISIFVIALCKVLRNHPCRGDYSTIFTEPEENNRFSIIAQVIIRGTAFSFILLVSSLKTSRNRAAAILKISASIL